MCFQYLDSLEKSIALSLGQIHFTHCEIMPKIFKCANCICLKYIDTVFLGQKNHDNQINAKFEKTLFIILKLVAYY